LYGRRLSRRTEIFGKTKELGGSAYAGICLLGAGRGGESLATRVKAQDLLSGWASVRPIQHAEMVLEQGSPGPGPGQLWAEPEVVGALLLRCPMTG